MSDKTTDLDRAQFIERFSTKFVSMIHPDDRVAWRPLADDIAVTYWDEPDQRADGPEACAEAEIGEMADA